MQWKDLTGLIGKAAPLLGGLFGGPPGAAVGAIVARELGVDATPDAVAQAIQTNPEAALKLAELQKDERIQLAVLAAQQKRDEATADNDAEKEFNNRLATYEGTAADLKSVPIVGPLMLFARGAFRPVFSYGVMYADFQNFCGAWRLSELQQKELVMINALVLGFFFGERALRNVLPIIAELLSNYAAAKRS